MVRYFRQTVDRELCTRLLTFVQNDDRKVIQVGCGFCREFVVKLTAIGQLHAVQEGIVTKRHMHDWNVVRKTTKDKATPKKDDSARKMLGHAVRVVLGLDENYEGGDQIVGKSRIKLGKGDLLIHTFDEPYGLGRVKKGRLVAVEGWLKT